MMRIVINEKYKDLLSDFVHNLMDSFNDAGETVYAARNTIKIFDIEGLKINVKLFKTPHLLNQFVYSTFRDSKACRSYNHALKLIERGFNTPDPIAYIEEKKGLLLKRSAYISIHEEFDGIMQELQKGHLIGREALIGQFAAFTAGLHINRILHLDYSSGNILYKKTAEKEYQFYLVDLNRMHFDKPIDLETGCFNLRRLWCSDEMMVHIANVYATVRNFDSGKCVEKALLYRRKFWNFFCKKYPGATPYIKKEGGGSSKFRIGFDAKRAAQNHTGLGNYSRFVISALAKFYPENVYELFSPKLPTENSRIYVNEDSRFVIKKGVSPFWRTVGITKSIKNENLDIYHGLSNELPYKINKTGCKSVVTIHDLIFRRLPKSYPLIDRLIYDAKSRYACKVADKIVAVSECTKRDIIHYYKTAPSKIEVVYQGCSEVFEKRVGESEKATVQGKYCLPNKFILSVGTIEERKNILLIAKALKYLPKDIHFVSVGRKRSYAKQVMDYVHKNDLRDRVHLISNVAPEELPAIFQLSEVFVYPSLYEGFGIPIIEALHSGVPVIGATGSCLEEAGGPDSRYIDPENEKQLANEIKQILEDEDLRRTMVDKGYEYVQRFSSRVCTDRLVEVYEKIRS